MELFKVDPQYLYILFIFFIFYFYLCNDAVASEVCPHLILI